MRDPLVDSLQRLPDRHEGPLLTIDADAELRKLSQNLFARPALLAPELVRAFVRGGARAIHMRLAFGRLTLTSASAEVPDAEVCRLLAASVDTALPGLERHAAITRLEALTELALLGPFALAAAMTLRAGGVELRWRRGQRPELRACPADPGCTLTVTGLGASTRAVKSELRDACRFAEVRVTLNGASLGHGRQLARCLVDEPLALSGVNGHIGIPEDGEVSRTMYLRWGIRQHEAVRAASDGLVTVAVVEAKGVVDALELEAQRGRIDAVVTVAATALYRRLAADYARLREPQRSRARTLLLRVYRRNPQAGFVEDAPLFPRADGMPDVSIAELRRAPFGSPLLAIGPTHPLDRFDPGEQPVLRLDAATRDFILTHLGLVVREPAPRVRTSSLAWRLLARAAAAPVVAARWTRGLVRRLVHPQAVPDHALEPEELRFLDAVRSALQEGGIPLPQPVHQVRMARSAPRLLFCSQGTAFIARDAPLVQRMVAVYGRDPRTLSALLWALIEG